VAEVALFSFPNESSLNRYYGERVDGITDMESYESLDDWYCGHSDRGDYTWTGGRIACWVSTTGSKTAHIRWTDERQHVYGIIDASNRDLTGIYEWWAQNVR
jgi:hypothetical protein